MKTACGWSEKSDESGAIAEAAEKLQKGLGNETPKLVVVFATGKKYDGNKIVEALKANFKPEVKIWGLNSDTSGIVIPTGMSEGLSLMGFHDPNMVVGIGTAPLDWKDTGSYEAVGKKAAEAMLKDAGKAASEPPQVVFFAGLNLVTDIDIFNGMKQIFGEVPICGGNTGQHTGESIPGDGYVLSPWGAQTNTVSVAGIWTPTKVGVAYGYGYTERPEHKGIVTKSDEKKRIIYEIDHRPAAEVYNEWTGGMLTDFIQKGGGNVDLSILGKYEIKKPIKQGSTDYVAVAFITVFPDKSVFVTHEGVKEGIELELIELGNEEEVVNKPAVVATVARNRAGISKTDVAGAVIVYCYALLYTAKGSGYDINPAFPVMGKTLGDAPFIGFFSGGEIGYSPHFENDGNRMMAFSNVVAVFGKN